MRKGLGTGRVMSYGGDMGQDFSIARQDGSYAAPFFATRWNHVSLQGTRPR